jgi:hypothetical protein
MKSGDGPIMKPRAASQDLGGNRFSKPSFDILTKRKMPLCRSENHCGTILTSFKSSFMPLILFFPHKSIANNIAKAIGD